jgi:hypothetical protein
MVIRLIAEESTLASGVSFGMHTSIITHDSLYSIDPPTIDVLCDVFPIVGGVLLLPAEASFG